MRPVSPVVDEQRLIGGQKPPDLEQAGRLF